jgi:site-specific DNA-methyltransferase (adenine-specific)
MSDQIVLRDGGQLFQGDCLEIMGAFGDDTFDALICDPPYCSGGVTEAGKGRATHQGLRSETMRAGRFKWFGGDNMTTAGLVFLLRSVAVEALRVVKPSGHLMMFCDWRMVPMLAPALESAGWRLRNIICWNKGHFGCGTGFRPQHEMVLHLTHRAPVFHAANVGNVITSKRVGRGTQIHPTEKPVDVMEQLIRVTTPKGGHVLDPFAGSGATGQAALDHGYRVTLIEREPGYVEAVQQRLSQLGGHEDEHDCLGVTRSAAPSPVSVSLPDLFGDAA